MRKVLLTALCLLMASPSLALAGDLMASGQAFVFGIFGAPPPAQITWFESNGVTKLAEPYVTGSNPVGTSFDGRFAFNLTPSVNIIRFGTFIQGEAGYFNGFFHVVGNSLPIDVLAGPSQTTTLTGIVVNMF